MLRILYLTCCLFILFTPHTFASPSIKDFSAYSEFSEVKISPDGKHLGVILIEDEKRTLLILNLEKMQPTYAVKFDGEEEVGSYYWVNDERIVLQKLYKKPRQESSVYYGELLAVNYDGSKSKYLFGYNGRGSSGSANMSDNESIQASAFVLDTLKDDDKYIYVMAYPWNSLNYVYTLVYKVNVYSGKRKRITTSPVANAGFLVDNNEEVRFSFARDSKNNDQLFYYDNNEWIDASRIKGDLTDFYPISFTEDNKSIYAIANSEGNTRAIYEVELASAKHQKIIQHDIVDPLKTWISDQTNTLYAVEFENGYPEYRFVDTESNKAKALQQLMAAIPDHRIRIVSETINGNTLIVMAMNDKNSGDYYLFDRQKLKLKFLFAGNAKLDPNEMSEVRPISFVNRDGVTIHGYLTLPRGIEHKNMPLVVNPHGGPHGPRDLWVFNPENQLLAQNGIAVLQVNFRGSGGYGVDFEESGYRAWGSKIQHDILDATQYAIDQGYADKNRVCVSGASFGGYSALMSPMLAPDMFKCAIGVAGVYDLEQMFETGDVPESYGGKAFLKEVLGSDVAQLRAMSPTHNVDKLKANVLLIHGEEDERAPIEQFEAMEKALKQANYPYQKQVWDKEGHGFYNAENRAKYYEIMLKFLKENLNVK